MDTPCLDMFGQTPGQSKICALHARGGLAPWPGHFRPVASKYLGENQNERWIAVSTVHGTKSDMLLHVTCTTHRERERKSYAQHIYSLHHMNVHACVSASVETAESLS